MKILHTADWHIGQRLHEHQRTAEHQQFLDWLLETVRRREVDLLLVSGDIFDTALPSAASTNLYYRFLYRLFEETRACTVITAGNHDSPRQLEAPREFLRMGRVHVVGIAAEAADCVFLFPNDTPQIAVAAVPYLSESDLRAFDYTTDDVDRDERYRAGIRSFYADCVSCMPIGLPKILMGHLFVHGGKMMDSERNIQIGGATAMHASDFPDGITYAALGHLHRPQAIKGQKYPIRYSGSPIPLRFNEASYRKKLYLLEISDTGTLVRDEEIDVPIFKELCTVKGDQQSILKAALRKEWNEKYIQIKLTLEIPRIGISDEMRQAFSERGGQVLSVEIELPQLQDTQMPPIEDMQQPQEIFEQYHKSRYNGKPPDKTLAQTFKELVEFAEEQQ